MWYNLNTFEEGDIMNVCVQAANASTCFEKNNSELKRLYLLKNIDIINTIMSKTPGYCGSFGTGYPFYTLDSNLNGHLPIINEQIRYNEELFNEAQKLGTHWVCAKCLSTTGYNMPDLKQICKPCPQIENSLKPRKVINRLPDVDMWMVCYDKDVETAKTTLSRLFEAFDMHTSDVNPVKTIQDVSEIATDLDNGEMPREMLPLDIHIIEYSKLSNLIDQIPFALQTSIEEGNVPYLPIHPTSLRKTWQHDDEAYNFVLDFLYSMTPFSLDDRLMQKLDFSRTIISNALTNEQLTEVLHSVAPASVERRFQTSQLQKTYERRVESWRK